MVLQNSDVSQSQEQVYYFSHKMTEEDKNRTKECKIRSPDQYIGKAVDVLYMQRHVGDRLTDVMRFDFKYRIACTPSHDYSYISMDRRNEYAFAPYTKELYSPYNAVVRAALDFTQHPDADTSIGFVRNFTQVFPLGYTTYSLPTTASLNETQVNETTTIAPVVTQCLTTTNGTTVYKHIQNARGCVNNTYINVVHDCNNICVHAILSNSADVMSEYDHRLYGIECAKRLAAMSDSQVIEGPSRDTLSAMAYSASALGLVAIGAGIATLMRIRGIKIFKTHVTGATRLSNDNIEAQMQTPLYTTAMVKHAEAEVLSMESTQAASQAENTIDDSVNESAQAALNTDNEVSHTECCNTVVKRDSYNEAILHGLYNQRSDFRQSI